MSSDQDDHQYAEILEQSFMQENPGNSQSESKSGSECSDDEEVIFNVSQNFLKKVDLEDRTNKLLADQSSICKDPAHPNDLTQGDIANILGEFYLEEET